jgi:peptide subunit release factor RF-3
MINKIIEYAVIGLIGLLALWLLNDRIEAHYQKPLLDKMKAVETAQKANNEKAAKELELTKSKQKTVYINRIKTIEKYAETLPKNNACTADAAFIGMFNNSN